MGTWLAQGAGSVYWQLKILKMEIFENSNLWPFEYPLFPKGKDMSERGRASFCSLALI